MKKIRMNCTATLDETFADLRRGFSEELRQLFPAGANESNRRENQNVCQRPLTALHGARGWRRFYICQITKTEREAQTSRSCRVLSENKWFILYHSISKRIDPQFATEEIRQFLRRNENIVIFFFWSALICVWTAFRLSGISAAGIMLFLIGFESLNSLAGWRKCRMQYKNTPNRFYPVGSFFIIQTPLYSRYVPRLSRAAAHFSQR